MRSAQALVLPILLAISPPTNERWTRTEIGNLVILSNASDRAARGVAENLLRLRQTLMEVSKLETRSPIPTYVYAFRNEASFDPYRVAIVGKNRESVRGIFFSLPDSNRILIQADVAIDDVVYHEFTHYFIRNTVVGIPLWLDEGLAEFYATFSPVGGGRSVRLGLPNKIHLTFLQEHGLMTLPELFAFEPLKLPPADLRVEQFYGESWLLAHYLLIGNPKRGAGLGPFLSLVYEGHPLAESFEKAFGVSMKDMQAEVNTYLQRGRYNAVAYTLSETGASEIPQPREIPRDEVLASLGDLLTHTDARQDGAIFLKEAIAANPRNAIALADLADVQFSAGQPEEAEKLYKRSIEAAGSDYRPFVWYGNRLIVDLQKKAREGERIAPAAIASVRELASRAIQLAPDDPNGYAILGATYAFLGEKPAEGIKASEKSFQIAPARLDVAADLVLLYRIAGQEKASASIIDRVIRPSRVERFLTEAKDNLTLGDYVRGMNLIESGRKPEGEALLQRALENVTNTNLKHKIVTVLATKSR